MDCFLFTIILLLFMISFSFINSNLLELKHQIENLEKFVTEIKEKIEKGQK